MNRSRARTTVAAALLVLAGCTVSTNDEPVAVQGRFERFVQTTTTTTTPTTVSEDVTKTVSVFFLRSSDGASELVPVEREFDVGAEVQEVLNHLFNTTPERGLSDAIPEAAELITAQTMAGTSTLVVDTRNFFGAVQGPQLRQALGQIVCTATTLGSVDQVSFRDDGRPVTANVGSGEAVDRAVTCSDYRTLA